MGKKSISLNNTTFRNDGWIVDQDEKKIRKWFTRIDGVEIWEPALKDLAKTESRYWNVLEKNHEYWNKKVRPIFDNLAKVGQAHAKISHKYTGENPPWWLYSASQSPYGMGISFEWVNEPETPLNLLIGQSYYSVTRHMDRWSKRKFMFQTALKYSIQNVLKETKPKDGQTLQLKINGRTYWYAAVNSKYDGLIWEKMSWPDEDNMIILEF